MKHPVTTPCPTLEAPPVALGRSPRPALRTSLLSLLVLCGSFAHAQAREEAVTRHAGDANLQWNPCPPFLPKGCGIAVLHGDPSKDNVDVFLRVPAQSTLPAHWHTSAERMILVEGELRVTYEGQKRPSCGPARMPMDRQSARTMPSARAPFRVSSSSPSSRPWTRCPSKGPSSRQGMGPAPGQHRAPFSGSEREGLGLGVSRLLPDRHSLT